MTTPQLADIGLVHVKGPVGTMIRIGQLLNGNGFKNYEHAFVCVGFYDDGTPRVVEAMPWGARYANPEVYGGPILWSTNAILLTREERQKIVEAAEGFIGTPYGFLTYLAIAAHRFHLPLPFLRRAIASTHAMICSQLCDAAYRAAGVELFPGQWPGYVTPAMLANLILSHEEKPEAKAA